MCHNLIIFIVFSLLLCIFLISLDSYRYLTPPSHREKGEEIITKTGKHGFNSDPSGHGYKHMIEVECTLDDGIGSLTG